MRLSDGTFVRPASRQRGATLVLSLLMLALLGLGAAAAMRASLSSERTADNFQRELLAHQYAEAGLRYCEAQMLLPSASRELPLQAVNIAAPVTVPAWDQAATWAGTQVVTVPLSAVASASNSTFDTVTPPQCHVEAFSLAQGGAALRVTARGFSPGYSADTSGRTASGSVVWLQSTLVVQ